MVCDGPGQLIPPPSKIGVNVTTAIIELVLLLEAVKDGIFPEPEALRPIEVVLFAQV